MEHTIWMENLLEAVAQLGSRKAVPGGISPYSQDENWLQTGTTQYWCILDCIWQYPFEFTLLHA